MVAAVPPPRPNGARPPSQSETHHRGTQAAAPALPGRRTEPSIRSSHTRKRQPPRNKAISGIPRPPNKSLPPVDQYSTYGTQIIVSTERDATFTLDEILGNTTELAIAEHTTDSHGQTLATFALFDLVGLRLSPRIAKLTDAQLWRPNPASHYRRWPQAGSLLRNHAQVDLIEEH